MKISGLIEKSRDLKRKLKDKNYKSEVATGGLALQHPGSTGTFKTEAYSSPIGSPQRVGLDPHQKFDLIDAKSFNSTAMKLILGINPNKDTDTAAPNPDLESLDHLELNRGQPNVNAEYDQKMMSALDRYSGKQCAGENTASGNNLDAQRRARAESEKKAQQAQKVQEKKLKEQAKVLYSSHFSGLQSIGTSGMTILEELIDTGFNACEQGRTSGQKHHARAAVLLSPAGAVYTGCDVHVHSANSATAASGGVGDLGVTAERAAILQAVTDGVPKFACIVIVSDTMVSFPTPDGVSREFLSSFGNFPIILVNSLMEIKHTSSYELFPMNEGGAGSKRSQLQLQHTLQAQKTGLFGNSAGGAGGGGGGGEPSFHTTAGGGGTVHFADGVLAPAGITAGRTNVDDDPNKWGYEQVQNWLINTEQEGLCEAFRENRIDGLILFQIDENFARDTLGIPHALKRRKLLRQISVLKDTVIQGIKGKTLDELDEYVMLLESHRIKLVAKLKAMFDKFDTDKIGKLNGVQMEQMLVYMNRPVDSNDVHAWLFKLKDNEIEIEFPEFVAQYTALFAGEDPDVPAASAKVKGPSSSSSSAQDENGRSSPSSPSSPSRRRRNDKDRERWAHEDQGSEDDDEYSEGRGIQVRRPGGPNEDIMDIKVLAELKGIFDRFAVDNLISAPEMCQALTEAGVVCPRREIAQYLRSRKILGMERSVSLFEFMRAFAAIKGMHKSFRDSMAATRGEEDGFRGNRKQRSGGGGTGRYGRDEDEENDDLADTMRSAARRRAQDAERRIRREQAERRSRSYDDYEDNNVRRSTGFSHGIIMQ